MPIDIDEFDRASERDLLDGESSHAAVFEYLAFNPDRAYSREEIQSATGLRPIELLSVLSRLERADLVRHKGRYWAIADGYEGADLPPLEEL